MAGRQAGGQQVAGMAAAAPSSNVSLGLCCEVWAGWMGMSRPSAHQASMWYAMPCLPRRCKKRKIITQSAGETWTHNRVLLVLLLLVCCR